MDKQTWLDVKWHQIELYRKRARSHEAKVVVLTLTYAFGLFLAITVPLVLIWFFPLPALGFLILIPVSILIWRISTYQNRSLQLLTQLADAIENEITKDAPLDELKKAATIVETRFLSNDDELFVKKALWNEFLDWKRWKRDLEMTHYDLKIEKYYWKIRGFFELRKITVGAVWNTDIPHRQGYKDSNTIEVEWGIMKEFRKLVTAWIDEEYKILRETSRLAQKNPVVFERYLRKKKISKKMKKFKRKAWVHYLSAAAKMRLVTFVESVLALEPTNLNEATVTLLHEKNEQIKKYTDEFWKVHWRSVKFYWFEALWLLLLIPFISWSASLISAGAVVEAVLLFTVGAALVAFGEMALVVRQKIKLNGKKLIPPLIASLIGSRHAMCADTNCAEGIDNYRRRFKNLEKHFIMTTPEIDSVKYVKDNLRDEERTSKLHEADDICEEAQTRMDTYYKMFHLYRRKCLQYGCIELFLAIMLVPAWGIFFLGMFAIGFAGIDVFFPIMISLSIGVFEIVAIYRHVRVWRFKEMYFKIYQGLSVLIVDGDLRLDPEKLNTMFIKIEQSALNAISSDRKMHLMVDTLSRVSGLIPTQEMGRKRQQRRR
ncbi:MAG: hypothetical protein FWC89_09385 [Defluviitaleaceae bacterium]|nr:hypothetical protein [Defluviitaleaceae bacterium]